jgi:L-amino acid N-acyltransferase YncA
VLAGDRVTPEGFRCLLFEADGEVVAVSALQAAGRACDWIVMGVANMRQGERLPDDRSLATAVAHETIRYAQTLGYRRIVALVHRHHDTSRHLVERLGFVRLADVDLDYTLFAAEL